MASEWQKADQLAIYKAWRSEFGTTENNPARGKSKMDLNSGRWGLQAQLFSLFLAYCNTYFLSDKLRWPK